MQLTDEQSTKVHEWIASGLKLAEIQDRLEKELGLRLSYMDVKFLVDDLKLTPKDPVEPEPTQPPAAAAPSGVGAPGVSDEDFGTGEPLSPDAPFADPLTAGAPQPAGAGQVAVVIDQITRPGAMVSGHATFSDGKRADWYLDQTGRFGMVPPEPGYRPSQADLMTFQATLDRELQKIGY